MGARPRRARLTGGYHQFLLCVIGAELPRQPRVGAVYRLTRSGDRYACVGGCAFPRLVFTGCGLDISTHEYPITTSPVEIASKSLTMEGYLLLYDEP